MNESTFSNLIVRWIPLIFVNLFNPQRNFYKIDSTVLKFVKFHTKMYSNKGKSFHYKF